MRPEALEVQKLCKKSMVIAFKALSSMTNALKEANLTPKEIRVISKNLERYQKKVEKKYSPKDNAPF